MTKKTHIEPSFRCSIKDITLFCGTIDLDYVGLPLAVEKTRAGFRTVGLHVQVAGLGRLAQAVCSTIKGRCVSCVE